MKGNGNGLLRKILLGLALMMLVVLFSASCGGSDGPQGSGEAGDADFLGLWVSECGTSTNDFFPDGRVRRTFEGQSTHIWDWSRTGGRLMFTVVAHSGEVSEVASYSISGDTMTLNFEGSGITRTFTRSR